MTSVNIKEEELPEYLGIIQLLCDEAKLKFVFIDGRIFASIEFNEASNAAHKHELRGRDVTDLLRQQKHAPQTGGVGTIAQQIDATKKQLRIWDKSFPFRLFLPFT
jgi:hypothetical protein